MNPVIIISPDGPEITDVMYETQSDCGVEDGMITIASSGDSGSLEYGLGENGLIQWQAESEFSGLAPGEYTVHLRNEDGSCIVEGITVELELREGPEITEVLVSPNTSCDVAQGIIEVVASGSGSGIEYSIDGGQTWRDYSVFEGLITGEYQVSIRYLDESCEVDHEEIITIQGLVAPTIDEVEVTTPLDCSSSTGTIDVLATPGSLSGTPYGVEYSIDGGNIWQSESTFEELGSGTYILLIRNDIGECEVSYLNNPIVIEIFGSAVIEDVVATDISDCGEEDGSIEIIATGGVDPLRYSIDNGISFQLDPVFENLDPGEYSIVVESNNGQCVTTYPLVEIGGPSPIENISVEYTHRQIVIPMTE